MRLAKLASLAVGMVVAAGGVLALGASAKPPLPPLLREEPTLRPLEKGDPLRWVTNNVVIATTAGNVQCPKGTAGGVLNSNGLKTDTFEITSADFEEQPCSSPLGLVHIHASGLPYNGTANTRGKAQILGPAFSATFAQTSLTCSWAASKLKSTFNGDGRAITVMTTNAKFKGVPGNSPACPKKGTFSADWSLTTIPPAGGSVPVVLR